MLNHVKKRPGGRWPCCSITTQSAGESVSATMPEITTEIAMVTANCR